MAITRPQPRLRMPGSTILSSRTTDSVTSSNAASHSASLSDCSDPDFGGPTQVVFSVDLTGLTGSGVTTGTAFVTPTKLVFVRPLAPVDSVDFTFPFFPSGAPQTTGARLGKATVNLVYNPALLRIQQGVVLVATAS